jgi:hypothetical protein
MNNAIFSVVKDILKRTWLLQLWMLLMLIWGIYTTFVEFASIIWLFCAIGVIIFMEYMIWVDFERAKLKKAEPKLTDPNNRGG